jgi:hypothetical protein
VNGSCSLWISVSEWIVFTVDLGLRFVFFFLSKKTKRSNAKNDRPIVQDEAAFEESGDRIVDD